MNTSKWEYSKLSKSLKGWREDIREQFRQIGVENIKRIKTRNAGYVNEESYAMLYSGEQILLGVKA
jgi:hypothetical protein